MAKVQTLWGAEEIQDLVKLELVDQKTYEECLDDLSRHMGEIRLKVFIGLLGEWLKNKCIVLESPDGQRVSMECVEDFFSYKKPKTEEGYAFVAAVVHSGKNIRLMLEQLPPCVMALTRQLLDCFYRPAEEIYKGNCGDQLLVKSESWYSERFKVIYPWFDIYMMYTDFRYYEEKTSFIGFDRTLYRYFLRAFTELPMMFRKEITAGEGLKVLRTEQVVVSGYSVLCTLYQQRVLVAGANRRFSVSVLRKCAKLTAMEEFFPDSEDNFLKMLRTTLVFPFFYGMFERMSKRSTLSVEDAFSGCAYSTFCSMSCLPLVLSHIKGIRYEKMNLSNCVYLVNKIWNFFRLLECPDQWVSVRALEHRLLLSLDGFELLHLFSRDEYSDSRFGLYNKRFMEERISYNNLRTDLMEPLVRGMLVLLASVGLLDVAYRDYDEEDRSWMDWLEAVRPTDLGKYVFGLVDEYEVKDLESNENCFDVDPERLIVRSLRENHPFESFLREVASYIGNHRYVFSETYFLQKCSSRQDVEEKMAFLKKFIVTHPSRVWKDFFKRLLNRCHPLTGVPSSDYTIYKLVPGDKELQHLFNTDEKLRSLVIRAEGLLILVEDGNKDKFLRRMKALGYVM